LARRPQPANLQPARLNEAELRAGIERLTKRLQAVRDFNPREVQQQFHWPALEKLEASIDDGLSRTFGHDTIEYRRYRPAASFYTGPVNVYHATPIAEVQEAVGQSRERSIALLEQAIEGLQEQLAEIPDREPAGAIEVGPAPKQVETNRVFIVHGHDGEAREAVARFVDQAGLEPIILHEQPNKGRTVIEKFEAHGDVSFAIVLLTPDDIGGAKDGPASPRARQNVVLELGYFIGRLGRDRVCALRRGDVEIPSDYLGVVYHELDIDGGWKQALAKELQAAGHEIDWNKVMRR
jgi:predicted nucleotide-binding protein